MDEYDHDFEFDYQQQFDIEQEKREFVDSRAPTPTKVYEPTPNSDPYEMSLEEMREWFVAHWGGPTNPYPQYWVEFLDLDPLFLCTGRKKILTLSGSRLTLTIPFDSGM